MKTDCTKSDAVTNRWLGSFLRFKREQMTINQTELSEKIGLDQSALSRIENGRQQLTAAQWFASCRIFSCSSDMTTAIDSAKDWEAEEIRLEKEKAKVAKEKAKLRALRSKPATRNEQRAPQ